PIRQEVHTGRGVEAEFQLEKEGDQKVKIIVGQISLAEEIFFTRQKAHLASSSSLFQRGQDEEEVEGATREEEDPENEKEDSFHRRIHEWIRHHEEHTGTVVSLWCLPPSLSSSSSSSSSPSFSSSSKRSSKRRDKGEEEEEEKDKQGEGGEDEEEQKDREEERGEEEKREEEELKVPLFLGAIALSEEISPSTRESIDLLKNRFNLEVFVCSGDNPRTTSRVAASLGIPRENVFSQALPQDKANLIYMLEKKRPCQHLSTH
ncbi:haloacid dehalogenase family hydrolase domain-containing protein, partial [Cystoisospora suis]